MKSLRVRKPTTQRNRARVLVFGKYLRAAEKEALQRNITLHPTASVNTVCGLLFAWLPRRCRQQCGQTM